MPLIELMPEIFAPAFTIRVNGSSLKGEVAKSILEVSVTQVMDQAASFRFQLNDPKLALIAKDNGLLKEGLPVEIDMGYVGNTAKLFAGEISAVGAEFPSSGPATVQVEGFDFLHRLTRGITTRVFGGDPPDSTLADHEVVQQVAKDAKLEVNAAPTPPRTGARIQQNKSNLAFLEELAEADGFFVWVQEQTLFFQPQPPLLRTNRIALEWGKNLLSFSPRLSTAGQVSKVFVIGWDSAQKQPIVGKAERTTAVKSEVSRDGESLIEQGAGGSSKLVLRDARVNNEAEATKRANAVLAKRSQGFLSGSGTVPGTPMFQAGAILDVRNVGRFSGEYVVVRVTHTVGSGGYQTSFEAEMNL